MNIPHPEPDPLVETDNRDAIIVEVEDEGDTTIRLRHPGVRLDWPRPRPPEPPSGLPPKNNE
jgi:hypothetical protein